MEPILSAPGSWHNQAPEEIIKNAAASAGSLPIAALDTAVAALAVKLLNMESHDQVELTRNLTTVVNRIYQMPAPEDSYSRFVQKAIVLIKSLEFCDLPKELLDHPAFHGKAIAELLNEVRELCARHDIHKSLRSFVRDYCEYLFNSMSSSRQSYQYLLRLCATYPRATIDEKHCQFFVTTYFDVPEKEIKHKLCARTEDTSGNVVWCSAFESGPTQIKLQSETYNSMEDLIAAEGSKYIPFPQRSKEEKKNYAVGYFMGLKRGEAKKAFQDDPIIDALCDKCFSMEPLKFPMITPEGFTYSRDDIFAWLEKDPRDPCTNSFCDKNMLKHNLMAEQLFKARTEQLANPKNTESITDWHDDPILKHFKDPLTGLLIETPVIANNNVTYDKTSIEQYLIKNDNRLPDKVPCTPPELVFNRVVAEVLEIRKEKFKNSNTGIIPLFGNLH